MVLGILIILINHSICLARLVHRSAQNEACLLLPFVRPDLLEKFNKLNGVQPYIRWFAERASKDISSLRSFDLRKVGISIEKLVKLINKYSGDVDGEHSGVGMGMGVGLAPDLTPDVNSFSFKNVIAQVDKDLNTDADKLSQNLARDLKLMNVLFSVATIPVSKGIDTSWDASGQCWVDPQVSERSRESKCLVED